MLARRQCYRLGRVLATALAEAPASRAPTCWPHAAGAAQQGPQPGPHACQSSTAGLPPAPRWQHSQAAGPAACESTGAAAAAAREAQEGTAEQQYADHAYGEYAEHGSYEGEEEEGSHYYDAQHDLQEQRQQLLDASLHHVVSLGGTGRVVGWVGRWVSGCLVYRLPHAPLRCPLSAMPCGLQPTHVPSQHARCALANLALTPACLPARRNRPRWAGRGRRWRRGRPTWASRPPLLASWPEEK